MLYSRLFLFLANLRGFSWPKIRIRHKSVAAIIEAVSNIKKEARDLLTPCLKLFCSAVLCLVGGGLNKLSNPALNSLKSCIRNEDFTLPRYTCQVR